MILITGASPNVGEEVIKNPLPKSGRRRAMKMRRLPARWRAAQLVICSRGCF
jgi:hypothetical protein